MEHGARYERPADHILTRGRRYGIEAKRREQQPGRHLAQIVVAREAIGPRVILALDDLFQSLLRAPRLAGIDIQIGDVMARLIAVRVVPDQSRYIFDMREARRIDLRIEQRIELTREGRLAAHGTNETCCVL